MSKARDELIRMLRDEKKWIVMPVGQKEITMHRKVGNHHISVRLEEVGDRTFRINPAGYTYQSSCSHYTYVEKETRWSRNKNMFWAILNSLKNSRAIDYISNLDEFIVINRNCKKSNKRRLAEDLKNLTSV
jgi:Cft2 family RNA processing exonuclease